MISEYKSLLSDISPLFTFPHPWSCTANSNDAERIVVEETGALLVVYIGEIPIHLADSDTMGNENLEKLTLLLQSLLLNLEDLVIDDITLTETSMAGLAGMFPKLHALRLALQRGPSVDSCARFLSLCQQPISFRATRRRISGILEDIKRIASNNSITESAAQPPSCHTPITTSQSHELSHACATGIFEAFQKHLKHCKLQGSDHKAFLHLKGRSNFTQEDQSDRVDILLGICPPQEAWQEVRCKFIGYRPLSIYSRDSCSITSICDVANETYDYAGVVQVHVCGNMIFNRSIAEEEALYPKARPTITLSNLLEKGLLANRYTFPEKHKLILAFNLAQSLLHLYSSQWIQKNWTAEQLFFMYETDKNKVHNVHQPYISCLFDGGNYESEIQDSRHKYPFVLAFGKLLLEIAEGEAIVVDTSGGRRSSLLRTLKLRFDARCKEDYFSKDYSRAILGCLKFQKLLQELTVGDELMKCRTIIQREIVEPLGREVSRFNDVSPGSQDLNLDHVLTQNTVKRVTQTRSSKASCSLENTQFSSHYSMSLPIRRIQFSDYSENISEEKKAFAKSFLGRFNDFQTTHTSRSEKAPRVKIAVLYTGLDFDDTDIRALRRIIECHNRSRESETNKSPIRETRNFTGDSDTDAEGHGTRVVELFLRIAPEADIYVAKISHKMTTEVSDKRILQARNSVIYYREELVNTRAKAFKWAVDDVEADIVSMSFGFDADPSWKDEMDKAIRNAYLSNKLLFAAASNYGANKRRTYPANATTVFCIHATDGNGNKSGMDPIPLDNSINFTTLGVAVPCGHTDGSDNFLSGSSYSTPIAAGIAANILDQAQVLQREGILDANECDRLHGYDGMKRVFELMACKTDGYDYLAPWNLWHEQTNADTVWENIKQAL